jgi:hypothetical protein
MVIKCDSFDHYQNNISGIMDQKYTVVATFGAQQLRRAGRWDTDGTDFSIALMNTGFGRAAYYWELPGTGTFYYAVDICTTRGTGGTFAGNSDFLSFAGYDSGSSTWKQQTRLAVRDNGRIQVWNGTGNNFTGTLVAETDPDTLEQDVWKRLTVRFNTTTGLVLYVDGVEVLDLSGTLLTVAGSGVSAIGRVGPCWESFGFDAIQLDNAVLWDTTGTNLFGLTGNLLVQANYVDSTETPDTTGTWTPSTGTNLGALVDDRPPDSAYPNGDTNYISASADAEAVFKFRRFYPPGDIMGVVVAINGRSTLSTVNVQAIVKGLTNYLHPTPQSLAASASYTCLLFAYDVDPEDSEPWDTEDFISQRWRFGVYVDIASGAYRLTQLVVEVVHSLGSITADYRAF